MANLCTPTSPSFENMDRSVLFVAIGGVVFNGLENSLSGVVLMIVAIMVYGLTRNRITNIGQFEDIVDPPSSFGIDFRRFTLCCQWLASRQLRDGLLGDLVDPAISETPKEARQYIRKTFCLAAWFRIKEKILTLLWLDRHR